MRARLLALLLAAPLSITAATAHAGFFEPIQKKYGGTYSSYIPDEGQLKKFGLADKAAKIKAANKKLDEQLGEGNRRYEDVRSRTGQALKCDLTGLC